MEQRIKDLINKYDKALNDNRNLRQKLAECEKPSVRIIFYLITLKIEN